MDKSDPTSLPPQTSSLIQRILYQNEILNPPELPPVVGGRWGNVNLKDFWGPIYLKGDELVWEPEAKGKTTLLPDRSLEVLLNLRNERATLELASGSRIEAEYGHLVGSGQRQKLGPGPTCEFNVWQLVARPASRWVAEVTAPSFRNANLQVFGPNGSISALHMRFGGALNWYLLRGTNRTTAVIEPTTPGPLNVDDLATDFMAMEVTLGTPMRLGPLVGLDGPGNVVSCAGLSIGHRQANAVDYGNGPVPAGPVDLHWFAVFFERLARAIKADDLPWNTACNVLIDSYSPEILESSYLKLHVALEVFSTALAKREGFEQPRTPLIRKGRTWTRWLKKHQEELYRLVDDPTDAPLFMRKLELATSRPSSDAVEATLDALDPPLDVDARIRKELRKRNTVAHTLAMNPAGEDYDVDRDVGRIHMLQCVLTSLMARAMGYRGLISGWERTRRGRYRGTPDWWPEPDDETTAAAQVNFFAGDLTQPPLDRRG